MSRIVAEVWIIQDSSMRVTLPFISSDSLKSENKHIDLYSHTSHSQTHTYEFEFLVTNSFDPDPTLLTI